MGLSSCISKARDAIKKAAKKQRNVALREGKQDTSAEYAETQEKALSALISKLGDIDSLDGDTQAAADAIRSVIEDLKLDRESVVIQIEKAGLQAPAMPQLAVDQNTIKSDASASGVEGKQKADMTVIRGEMFTQFLPNTPEGVSAFSQMAVDTEGTGKVLNQHADSVIEQLKAAGYSVENGEKEDIDADALLAELFDGQVNGNEGKSESEGDGYAVKQENKLTPAQAAAQFEWRNLGQRDGTKTQALFFYETADDMAAKRGSMQYGEITSFDGGKWQIDGVIYDTLAKAKKAAEAAATARLVGDGYVESPFAKYDAEAKSYGYEVKPDGSVHLDGKATGITVSEKSGRLRVQSSSGNLLGTYPAEPEAIGRFLKSFWYAEKKDEAVSAPDSGDRNSFTLERLNQETNKMEAHSFQRGQYVKTLLSGAGAGARWSFGEIEGISQAKREAKVDGLWYPFGAIYEAERPAAPAENTVPMSEVIDAVNEANGEGLTDADKIATVDDHKAFIERLEDGSITIDQFKAHFESVKKSKDMLIAELGKLTKDALLKMVGGYRAAHLKNDKKDRIVDTVYRGMLDDFVLGDSISYGFGAKYEDVIGGYVSKYSQDDISAYSERIKAARAERKQQMEQVIAAIKDPQTLADYKTYLRSKMNDGMTIAEARMTLPTDKRAMFDDQMAEESRNARGERKEASRSKVEAAAQTTAGQLFETKHTKTGEPLFVVKTADRVEREIYNQWNATAKRLGGYYSSYRGNGAIPGFTFKTKESAESFMQYLGGDTVAAQEAIKADRDAFADDKAQTAVERLSEMADRLEQNADAVLSADRKVNTSRRAGMAASAESAANKDKALAQTMRNISKAIADGKAKFLDMVRQKTQVEMLRSKLETAKYDEARSKDANQWYSKELHKAPPTLDTVDFAQWPTYTAFRSDLARMGRELLQIDGGKRIGQAVLKVADDITQAYQKFAKENLHQVSTFKTDSGGPAVFSTAEKAEEAIARSGFKGKATTISFKRGQHLVIMGPEMAHEKGLWQGDDDQRITLSPELGEQIVAFNKSLNKRTQDIRMPWVFDNVAQERSRWKSMGIETPAEMRAALREFLTMNERPKEIDKIKELERSMVGRKNDGLDFFPTSREVVQQMLDAADIQEGMSVLEPSAGMGHIADQIRQIAGVDPDVVELSGDRRELLEAKGYRLVASDFTEMNPRGFTFGDVFRTPDGVVGVMRGSGGLGSNRVGLNPLDETGKPDERRRMWVDRDTLEGVEKRGSMSGYDRIIMNPPFSNRRDAEHVQHAYTLLRPGGRIVAIMGEGVFFGQDTKAVEFREWLESVGGTSEKLPDGSFLDPSLPVTTGVNARMVVIEKPASTAIETTLYQSGVQNFYDQYRQQAVAFNDESSSILRQSDSGNTGGTASDGFTGRLEIAFGEKDGRRYSTLADGVAKDFKSSGGTTLIGKTVESPLDLAVAAQVYRDPRVETARYFLVKSGVIVGQVGVSSRKPGVTKALFGDTISDQIEFAEDVSNQAKALGADSILMLHNHPDGKPVPSDADMAATDSIAKFFERRGLSVPYHVIINHKSYGVISVGDTGLVRDVKLHDFGEEAGYDITNPKQYHPLLGQQIFSPDDLALNAKKAQVAKGQIVIIGLSGSNGIRTINEVTPAQLRGKFGGAILRRIAKQTGSDRLFAYGVYPSGIGLVQSAIRSGLLVDGIVVDNGVETSVAGMADTVGPMNGYSLGTQDAGYVVEAPVSAWHGSPHDHDKFDSSKIGTGEGAQAYGYGHYFASSREIAEWYKNKLSKKSVFLNGYEFDIESDPGVIGFAMYQALTTDGDLDYALEKLDGLISDDELAEVSSFFANNSIEVKQTGKLYQVTLPEESTFLLWDKPLSEQTDEVKAALESMPVLKRMRKIDESAWLSYRGQDIYKELSAKDGAASILNGHYGSDKSASEYLKSIGINGIKYLDGQSRDSGQGSYNYVVFDDADIQIDAKYAKNAKRTEQTPQQTREALTGRFGERGISALEKAGMLRIMRLEDAPDAIRQEAIEQGASALYTADGTAYLFSDRMTAEEAPGKLLHELGEHHGLEKMLGSDGWSAIKRRVSTMAKARGSLASGAWNGVKANYSEFTRMSDDVLAGNDRFIHEVLAAIGENQSGQKTSLWREILAKVKAWLASMGFAEDWINEGDIANLVSGSLKRVMRDAEGMTVREIESAYNDVRKGAIDFWKEFENAIANARGAKDADKSVSERLVRAFSQTQRGGVRYGRLSDNEGVHGEEVIDYIGEPFAGFTGYKTTLKSVKYGKDYGFTMYVVPSDIGDVTGGSSNKQLADVAAMQFQFIHLGDDKYELGVSEALPGTKAMEALQSIGRVEGTGNFDSTGREYYRLKLDDRYQTMHKLMSEAVRRLAVVHGGVPEVYFPRRDTGARAGLNKSRSYTQDQVKSFFSKSSSVDRQTIEGIVTDYFTDIVAAMKSANQLVEEC